MDLSSLAPYPRARNHICNGVGPAGFGWLFPQWIPTNHLFRPAANLHDLLYWIGGSPADRRAADNAFLSAMLAIASKQGRWSGWYILAAFVYWLAVRWGGRRAFHAGIKRELFHVARLERALELLDGPAVRWALSVVQSSGLHWAQPEFARQWVGAGGVAP